MATIKETILSFPGLSDIDDTYVDKVISDRSIDGATAYSSTYQSSVDLCAADCYAAVLASPDFSEGKLSIKMSRGAIRAIAKALYMDNGETANANKLKTGRITDKTNSW